MIVCAECLENGDGRRALNQGLVQANLPAALFGDASCQQSAEHEHTYGPPSSPTVLHPCEVRSLADDNSADRKTETSPRHGCYKVATSKVVLNRISCSSHVTNGSQIAANRLLKNPSDLTRICRVQI
jgi:hypothetical protein